MKNKKTEIEVMIFDNQHDFACSFINSVLDWWLPSCLYIGNSKHINCIENRNLYRIYKAKQINEWIKAEKLMIIHKQVGEKQLYNYKKTYGK